MAVDAERWAQSRNSGTLRAKSLSTSYCQLLSSVSSMSKTTAGRPPFAVSVRAAAMHSVATRSMSASQRPDDR